MAVDFYRTSAGADGAWVDHGGDGASLLGNLSPITLAAWVWCREISTTYSEQQAMAKRETTTSPFNQGFAIAFRDNGTTQVKCLRTYIRHSVAAGTWITPTNSVQAQKWHHIVSMWTRANPVTDVRMWIDGIEQTVTADAVASGNVDDDTPSSFTIGGRPLATNCWYGMIDDVRVFNRLVSDREIKRLASGYRLPIGDERLWSKMRDAYTVFDWSGHPLASGELMPDSGIAGLKLTGNPGNLGNAPVARASDAPRWPHAV